MTTVPYALYDAFSDHAFGGSQAGLVSDAAWLDAGTRQRIATEIGAPATGFITASSDRSISARFHSTRIEYPMCGHGTISLMTRMVEQGIVRWNGADMIEVELILPTTTAAVEIHRRHDDRPLVMLDIKPPIFRQDSLDLEQLAGLLSLRMKDYRQEYPVETAAGDFNHLLVPVNGLAAMRRIHPHFEGLTRFCQEHGVHTVAVFCTEVEQTENSLHVRDFCPLIGVLESAAAGTTNAALTSYMVRNGVVAENGDEPIVINSEQGHEIERPSSIRSVVSINDGNIARLQVGGVATKFIEGELHLPHLPQ
jgi:trans-2,3-dihydro-3-hydroxyanthranilate isomerase